MDRVSVIGRKLHPDEYLPADPRRASALPATVFREAHRKSRLLARNALLTLAEIIPALSVGGNP